ncbi:autotransporter outer membrane beta-barrel domain-containing protein [Sphingomonas sp. HMP6]|uniref:autotransporter outer membrane beta-barrel domain-containing protein n=1 Tax=Sphingomonas sp. HMP6 TaxID=1517551 RepID=UPI001E6209EC|nr:autotransporter outer membrane beta-barrel domain-containing protein [Sphingomonas sp. HMP6]
MIKSSAAMMRLRPFLLAGVAGIGLVTGGVAQAQVATGPTLPAEQPGSGARVDGSGVLLEAHTTGGTQVAVVAPEPYIAIANPGTPTTARDPVNITGVGQMIVSTPGATPGSVSLGLCTGSLINPRTVLFAAHCVNSRPATDYGSGSGGVAISFGFNASNNSTLPGAPAGTSPLRNWLFGATGRAANTTSIAENFYTVNSVVYNPLSTQPGNGFLYGDVALASLDTPTRGIPTWALLFSALPGPATAGAAGTGYHVAITGYGNNGTGETGANGGIDYRRRVAENFLGGLTSLDDFQNFIFGTAPGSLPQNLYWIDFDDPRRGTAAASPYDFNSFRDNALPNEGGTAPGDSGGPLILDATFSRKVILGVLSGGFSRFYNAAPVNGYGSNSFYQPLYLYWDYIAANNPYRYVSALAGDGNWSDASRWVTNIDPNYTIIGPNGQLVNGVPTTPGGTTTDVSGKFGQICFQNPTLSDCLNVATGVETLNTNPIGTAGLSNDAATVTMTRPEGGALGTESDVVGELQSQATAGAQALPAATIANGLPGATNFVPNNIDPVRTTGAIGRYFDVTLSANGTTTLNSTVTIDRFTLSGAGARLNIDSTGFLTSLIDVTQMTGTMQVNGRLTTQGDYFLMAGGLNGTGTISTPFFTSVLGTISPGATGNVGSIGTLTFNGNVILSSGNRYLVDLGANGVSDRIVATAGTGGSTGAANVGGVIGFSFSPTTLRAGNVYTILTAAGGVTGTFVNPGAFSAILTPRLSYSATAVTATIDAGLYANVVGTSPVQRAYAQLLDQNRASGGYLDIYGPLDLQNATTIQSTLDSLAPRNQTLQRSLGTLVMDNSQRFTEQRLAALQPGALDGTLAIIGNPLQVATARTTAADVTRGTNGIATAEVNQTARLPEGTGAFIAAGYLDGDSRPMATAIPLGGRDQFNGYYVAGGIETEIGTNAALGFALSYTNVDGTTTAAQTAKGELYQGTVYGKVKVSRGVVLDGQASIGIFYTNTRRDVSIVGSTFTLTGQNESQALAGEFGVSTPVALDSLSLAPRFALRASRLAFGGYSENGGGPALRYERRNFDSIQGLAGVVVSGGKAIKPYLSAYYVHEFNDRAGVFGANFAGGNGPNAIFALTNQDLNWAEVAGGISYGSRKVSVSVGADTTIGRGDVSNQSYRASIKIGF